MKCKIGFIIAIFTTGSFGAFPDSIFLKVADSLFNLPDENQKKEIEILKARHTFFLVTTCKTIPVPYSRVLAALQDIKSYKRYFRFMKRSEFVSYEDMGDSVALFETGVAFYVAWYAGKIRRIESPGVNECRLICSNVDQRLFRNEWTGKINGLVKIGNHDVHLEWRIRDAGAGKTRIALTVAQAPAVYIPRWLLKIAFGSIFPGMLVDLEKVLG